MKQNEWIAVFVAMFVVGFFFIFGQTIINAFNSNSTQMENGIEAQKPDVTITDTLIGGGDIAETGNRVTVHYTGHFVDGTVFDSSLERKEPFQFVLGEGSVIKGWDTGIVGMRVGGKRTLTVPPELGYGPNDYGPIPGNSTLVFDIELLKVER